MTWLKRLAYVCLGVLLSMVTAVLLFLHEFSGIH